ncbi:MAG: hypothetical protein WCP73_02335, partial [Eubacteriales bacterium]
RDARNAEKQENSRETITAAETETLTADGRTEHGNRFLTKNLKESACSLFYSAKSPLQRQ